MAAAVSIERRLGPSAAGWVAALPVSFAVAVVTVTLDAGTATASTMALSAATHSGASDVRHRFRCRADLPRVGPRDGRRGLRLCRRLGRPWRCTSRARCGFRDPFADARAVFDAQRPATPGSLRRRQTTAMTCASASLIVGATVVTSRLAGPQAAGAVLAFSDHERAPRDNRRDARRPLAGAHALTGLVRSLPRYLAFGLVVIVAGTLDSLSLPSRSGSRGLPGRGARNLARQAPSSGSPRRRSERRALGQRLRAGDAPWPPTGIWRRGVRTTASSAICPDAGW